MTQLELEEAPSGVSADVWRSGTPGEPAIGDLWLLSWDREALALGVIAGVAPSFVLAWPVTLPQDPTFSPGVEVPDSPLGTPLVVWPTRETGVGKHLLHRRFGSLLSERTMALINAALEDENIEMPLDFAPELADSEAEVASDEMVDAWEAICLNVWPETTLGRTPFNSDSLRAAGLQVGDLCSLLNLSVPEASRLFNGESAPTAEQVAGVEVLSGASAEELLAAGFDESTLELLSPDIKDDLLDIAAARGISESDARELVRTDFALAARSDGIPRSRLEAVINRLRSEHP